MYSTLLDCREYCCNSFVIQMLILDFLELDQPFLYQNHFLRHRFLIVVVLLAFLIRTIAT